MNWIIWFTYPFCSKLWHFLLLLCSLAEEIGHSLSTPISTISAQMPIQLSWDHRPVLLKYKHTKMLSHQSYWNTYIYIYIISKQYTHSKAICGLSAHPKKCRLKVSAFFPHCDRSWAYGFPCLAIHLHDQDSKDTEILKKTDSELRQSQLDFCQLFTKSTAEMESECK